ncbi:Hypothetical predicted protein [Olea europaea subsp. europaea]|uniref:Uncharacterized protein n=1 Tax=Olea europaea subsp. europaea TaxID=158383 RepID=A0A8S0TB64_OLEEU|nr:Hypothetical predicted protein [Olea europaea subsp. europaea]
MLCAGHVRDSSVPQQGCSLISRHFYAVFGTRCVGHVLAAIGTQPDFLAFLGSVWVVEWYVWAVAGMQLDFQAFLGYFWDIVCKPRPRRIRDAARYLGISRQFLGDGVQAMNGMLLDDDRDAARSSGISGKFLGTVCWPLLGLA